MNINSIQLNGFIGKDPISGESKSGTLWARASIGYSIKNKDNTFSTNWISVGAFKERAEELSKAKKGDGILVIGSIKQNIWTNKEGVKINETNIIAQELKITPKSEAEAPQEYSEDGGMF